MLFQNSSSTLAAALLKFYLPRYLNNKGMFSCTKCKPEPWAVLPPTQLITPLTTRWVQSTQALPREQRHSNRLAPGFTSHQGVAQPSALCHRPGERWAHFYRLGTCKPSWHRGFLPQSSQPPSLVEQMQSLSDHSRTTGPCTTHGHPASPQQDGMQQPAVNAHQQPNTKINQSINQ